MGWPQPCPRLFVPEWRDEPAASARLVWPRCIQLFSFKSGGRAAVRWHRRLEIEAPTQTRPGRGGRTDASAARSRSTQTLCVIRSSTQPRAAARSVDLFAGRRKALTRSTHHSPAREICNTPPRELPVRRPPAVFGVSSLLRGRRAVGPGFNDFSRTVQTVKAIAGVKAAVSVCVIDVPAVSAWRRPHSR